MIHITDDGVLQMEGSGIDLLTQMSIIVSRMISDMGCDPEFLSRVLLKAQQHGIDNIGKKHGDVTVEQRLLSTEELMKSLGIGSVKELDEFIDKMKNSPLIKGSDGDELIAKIASESLKNKAKKASNDTFSKMFGDMLHE